MLVLACITRLFGAQIVKNNEVGVKKKTSVGNDTIQPLEKEETAFHTLASIANQNLQTQENVIVALRKKLALKETMLAKRNKQVMLLKSQLRNKEEALNVHTQTFIEQRTQLAVQGVMVSKLTQEKTFLHNELQASRIYMQAILTQKVRTEEQLKEMKKQTAETNEKTSLFNRKDQLAAAKGIVSAKA